MLLWKAWAQKFLSDLLLIGDAKRKSGEVDFNPSQL